MERNSGKQEAGDPSPTHRHLNLIRFESRTDGFVPEDERYQVWRDETPANPEASGSVTYEISPDGDLNVTFQDVDS